jgi:hypothetical protein
MLAALCSTAGAATQLQWKLAKGKTYYQKTVAEQQITQSMMGQEQKIEQSMGTGMKLQVLDVDAQGNMRIQYTYLWSRLKQVSPMAQVDYDSSKQSAIVPAGAEGFAALVGQSYTTTMTPKGKVLDVNGVEQLKAAVLKKLPPGAENGPMGNTMATYIDKDKLKQMTEARMAVYPDKPVNPGESWTKDVTLAVGFPLTIQSKWTLQKEEAGVATIVATANMKTDPSKPMDVTGVKLAFDMSGTQEGTAQVAEATGLITSDKERQQLKGNIKIAAPAAGQPEMAIPMTMDTQVTEEMSEQMWKTSPQ